MGPLGGFVVVSMREEFIGYGAEALVVQGRPPAHGVGQVFDVAGRGGEAARADARRGQAYGLASRAVAQGEGRQEGLTAQRSAVAEGVRRGTASHFRRYFLKNLLKRRRFRRGPLFHFRNNDLARS